MNPVTFALIIELFVLIAKAVPKIAPGIQDLLKMLKGEDVEDISKEEAIARIDAAIAKLP
jgi:hypothetical protein